MGNIQVVPLVAMIVLVATCSMTYARTRDTVAAFTMFTVTLFFVLLYLMWSDNTRLNAYLCASSIFFHAWVLAWLAHEGIPAVRTLLKAEEEARLSAQLDRLPKEGE